jgi:peptidoglycan hydrolase-like protein with peptidoglycan-binding domain
MRTSTLPQLQEPTTIVLAAGHGASDTGAEFGQFKERDEAIVIVDRMAADLRARGVTVEIAPHEEDTPASIRFVNERFGFGDAWVLEIHRDSASGLDPDDASLRCGIYYGTSEGSRQVGEFMRGAYIRHGAHSKSWARADTESRHKSLGWIRQTRPTSHLLELGFMEGRNDDAHLDHLAKIGAAAVFEAFTGGTTAVLPPPTPGPRPVLEPPVPSPTTSHLRSRLFAGNAGLEAVADGHRVFRSGAQRVDEIGLVQDALNRLAALGGNYRIDLGSSQQFRGFFGPKTEHAVRTFEADFRLTTNGIVDVETILALDDALAKSESGLNPLPIVSPATEGIVYVPPAASAALLSGLDFSKGTGDKGMRYRAAYARADGDPRLAKGDPSNCKALLRFPKAVFFEAKMAICADGSPRSNGDRPGSIDRPHGQLHTAKKNPVDSSDFNAEVVPYIVLPGTASHGNFVSDFNVKDRDLAVVICKGQITPAFFGEVGPPFRLGEASIQVHENLVPAVRFPWTTPSKTSIRNASVEGGVLYFVFPGTAVAKVAGMSADQWLEATLQAATDRFEAFLASGGTA